MFSWSSPYERWLHKYTFDQHVILRFSRWGCADAWVGLQFCLHLSLQVNWEDAKRGENRADKSRGRGGWETGMPLPLMSSENYHIYTVAVVLNFLSCEPLQQSNVHSQTPHWTQMSTGCDKFNQKLLYLSPEEEEWSSNHKKMAKIKEKWKTTSFCVLFFFFAQFIFQPPCGVPDPKVGNLFLTEAAQIIAGCTIKSNTHQLRAN